MQSRLRKRNKLGFTLIELMIVIAIIGILAAILTPILLRARLKTYHTACVQNQRNTATALELYSLENEGEYPATLVQLTATGATTRPYIQALSECPSINLTYDGTYSVAADFRTYQVDCPGIHELQLPGIVDDTYPRVTNGLVEQFRAGD